MRHDTRNHTAATAAGAMTIPINGVDHAIIGVRDLESARETFARLGFTMSPRGRHIGRGTANYCMMFEHDYLELRGIVDASQFAAGLDRFLEQGEGLAGLVFSTGNAEDCRQALLRSGIWVEEPMSVSRVIELPDEEVTLGFKLLHLPDEHTPNLHAVIIQHLTLALLRRPDWLSHANGAHAISVATVVVDALAGLTEAYGRLFGADYVSEEKGAVTVATAHGKIVFATPTAFADRHYDVKIDDTRTLPRLMALELQVRDPKATALYLSGQRIAYEQEPDGTVLVPPSEACGVMFEFARES